MPIPVNNPIGSRIRYFDRDFPEDATLENGSYYNVCNQCGTEFIGHKQRVTCKLCYATVIRRYEGMKATYKGHEIIVEKEVSSNKHGLMSFSITRKHDGYECLSSFENSAERPKNKLKELMERIDNELSTYNPWEEGYDNA